MSAAGWLRRRWQLVRLRWDAASLAYDLEHGRRPRGRTVVTITDPVRGIRTAMPVQTSVRAVVVRADGTREPQGVIGRSRGMLTERQQAALTAAARRRDRRGKR